MVHHQDLYFKKGRHAIISFPLIFLKDNLGRKSVAHTRIVVFPVKIEIGVQNIVVARSLVICTAVATSAILHLVAVCK